jgi:acylphosphatase
MQRRVNLVITGRVQGVFFRASTQQKARELKINGWVKNLVDGRVEVMAQADADALEHFIDWCRHGPANARVDHVEITEMIANDVLSSFLIV